MRGLPLYFRNSHIISVKSRVVYNDVIVYYWCNVAIIIFFFYLQDPVEIKLGDCYDSQGYGDNRTKVIGYDSFQYVPLFDSLASLLNDRSIYDEIVNVRNASSSELLSDFCDGSLFKTHPIFSTDPHALQIILYYDELEIANPIGCFVKQHKIGCVMFLLGNVHPKFRSSLKAMYLVAIATVPTIENYGIDRILQPFVRDINKLTESGITVNIDGTNRTFHGALLAVIADTLASHQLGGFKGSMSWALRMSNMYGYKGHHKIKFC